MKEEEQKEKKEKKENEDGIKWWIRYVFVPIAVAIIGARTVLQYIPPPPAPPTPNDPFVGYWVATDYDNSALELAIGIRNNRYRILYYDVAASSCGKTSDSNPYSWVSIGSGELENGSLIVDFSSWCLSDSTSSSKDSVYFIYHDNDNTLELIYPGSEPNPIIWHRTN